MILKSKRREEKVICTFPGQFIALFRVSVFQLMKRCRISQCEPQSCCFNLVQYFIFKANLHPLALGSPQSSLWNLNYQSSSANAKKSDHQFASTCLMVQIHATLHISTQILYQLYIHENLRKDWSVRTIRCVICPILFSEDVLKGTDTSKHRAEVQWRSGRLSIKRPAAVMLNCFKIYSIIKKLF